MTDTALLPDVDLNALLAEGNLSLKESRTAKVLGLGYGSNPVTVNALFDNMLEVYTGEVPTVDQPVPTGATGNETTLFTFPVAVEWKGNASLEITVTSGTLTISGLVADHNILELPGATESFHPISSTGSFWETVTIDGVAQEPGDFYTVNEGSTISLSLTVSHGVYTALCPAPTV